MGQLTDGLRVLVSLTFSWGTTIFTVVGELIGISMSGDSVRVNNTGTTTGNHGPDAALGIENSEFEGSTGRGIEFLDVCLLFGQITTEGSRPDLVRELIQERQ
jgi:hypothetical protein